MEQTRKDILGGHNKHSLGGQSAMQPEGESLQKYSVNFLEQVKAFEDTFGPLLPTKERDV